jgi:hypothetical protein
VRISVRESSYKPILSNSLQREKDSSVKGIKLNEIIDAFERLGYSCKTRSELVGQSGYKHIFDIVAGSGSDTIVIDIISNRTSILDALPSDYEISDQISFELLRMRAKTLDCGPSLAIIIQLTSYFSDSDGNCTSQYGPIEQISAQYKIKVIRSSTIAGAARKILGLMNSGELAEDYV